MGLFVFGFDDICHQPIHPTPLEGSSPGPSVMIFVFVGIFAIKWFLGLNGRVIPSHLRNPLAPFFSITRMAAILDFKMAAVVVHF